VLSASFTPQVRWLDQSTAGFTPNYGDDDTGQTTMRLNVRLAGSKEWRKHVEREVAHGMIEERMGSGKRQMTLTSRISRHNCKGHRVFVSSAMNFACHSVDAMIERVYSCVEKAGWKSNIARATLLGLMSIVGMMSPTETPTCCSYSLSMSHCHCHCHCHASRALTLQCMMDVRDER